MKKSVLAIFVVFIIVFITSCVPLPRTLATERFSAFSPSGRYELSIVYDRSRACNRFSIRDWQNMQLYTSQDCYLVGGVTYFIWGDNDRVWVYSFGEGTAYWEQVEGGWVRYPYRPSSSPTPPPFIAPLVTREER